MARKFLVPVDLTGLEILNVRYQNLSADPTPSGTGHVYYNTSANEVRVWNGTAWLASGVVLYGNDASKPAALIAGRLYAATDTQTLYLDNGTTWTQIGDAEGAAAAAQSAAESYADSLASNYDPAGSAAAAQAAAEGYADSLASNYDPAGSAAAAQAAAEGYADSLASNYDPAGSAAAAQAAAEGYADSLASNYDPAGAAAQALIDANAYTDSVAQGLDVKESCRVASTANIATLSGLLTIDTVTVADGDRVLVKNQTTASENGIYVAHSGAWTRAADFVTDVTAGAFTFIEEGSTLADTGWVLTTNGTIVIGTTNLTFTQFSGAGSYLAGNGLTLSGNTFSAKVKTSGGVVVDGDGLAVDTSIVARKYSAAVGDGTNTTYTLTHGLGTRDIQVTVYDASTYAEVFTDVLHVTTTTVEIGFAAAPTTNAYRVVVTG